MKQTRPALSISKTFCLALIASLTLASNSASARDLAGSRPNIILIMCDDAGFADFGFSGGISDTPVLDRLRSEGMFFTHAYNNARCMPTRASLMTGLNPETAGFIPLKANTVTIPEVLKGAGYASYMVGKWHLGLDKHFPKGSKLQSTPVGRGFDKFYGIWEGANGVNKEMLMRDKNTPRLVEGNRRLEWDEVPDDYYNTTTWTDKAIEYMRGTPEDQPFFLYVAHTAPHWPLDPQPEYVKRYEGRFDAGWDAIRERILARQKELGIIPQDYPMPPREYGVLPYSDDLPEVAKYREWCAKYYASITEMDEQIGRLLETVKQMGRADNTIVFFLSDNGADDVIGGKPRGNTSNMPFMGWKLTYFEGGAASPLLAYWPGVVPANTMNKEHVVILEDFMSTIVELADAEYPTERLGHAISPMEGRSFIQAMLNPDYEGENRTLVWSHDGQRGVWQDPWKAVLINKAHPSFSSLAGKGSGYYNGTRDGWYLYRIDENRIESEDLAAKHPEKMQEMIGIWRDWAQKIRWVPDGRWGLHPTDAENGIRDFSAE